MNERGETTWYKRLNYLYSTHTPTNTFKEFCFEQEPRLKVLYPFLTHEQIKGKVLDRWRKIHPAEDPKNDKGRRKNQRGFRKYPVARFIHRSSNRIPKNAKKATVKAENDRRKKTFLVENWLTENARRDKVSQEGKTFERRSFSLSSKVPDVISQTSLSTEKSILKTGKYRLAASNSEDERRRTSRVSFSSYDNDNTNAPGIIRPQCDMITPSSPQIDQTWLTRRSPLKKQNKAGIVTRSRKSCSSPEVNLEEKGKKRKNIESNSNPKTWSPWLGNSGPSPRIESPIFGSTYESPEKQKKMFCLFEDDGMPLEKSKKKQKNTKNTLNQVKNVQKKCGDSTTKYPEIFVEHKSDGKQSSTKSLHELGADGKKTKTQPDVQSKRRTQTENFQAPLSPKSFHTVDKDSKKAKRTKLENCVDKREKIPVSTSTESGQRKSSKTQEPVGKRRSSDHHSDALSVSLNSPLLREKKEANVDLSSKTRTAKCKRHSDIVPDSPARTLTVNKRKKLRMSKKENRSEIGKDISEQFSEEDSSNSPSVTENEQSTRSVNENEKKHVLFNTLLTQQISEESPFPMSNVSSDYGSDDDIPQPTTGATDVLLRIITQLKSTTTSANQEIGKTVSSLTQSRVTEISEASPKILPSVVQSTSALEVYLSADVVGPQTADTFPAKKDFPQLTKPSTSKARENLLCDLFDDPNHLSKPSLRRRNIPSVAGHVYRDEFTNQQSVLEFI